jgi:hypothetical protein
LAGFSFDLKYDYSPGPLAAQMITRVLQWNGVDTGTAVDAVAAQLLALANDGSEPRSFWKWCVTDEAPYEVRGLSKKWADLLFASVSMYLMSVDRRKQSLAVTKALPLWRYDRVTEYCSGHRSLDKFVARFDDPIWEKIYPPNGWLCGCVVLAVMDGGQLGEKVSTRKIPEDVLLDCSDWLNQRPDRQLAMLR